MAVACLLTVQYAGWRVLDDMTLIGVGGEIFSRYITPP
jgi:DNA-binding LacI/PurR family transcriptional regulator